MKVQRALIEISRKYEGINFLHNDFEEKNPILLIEKIHFGSPTPFLEMLIQPYTATKVQFMADNSSPELVFIAMVQLDGIFSYPQFTAALESFNQRIEFEVEIRSKKEIFETLAHFKGIETLISAILGQKQVLVIADQEIVVRNFILELLHVFPPQILGPCSILSNSDRYIGDVRILGLNQGFKGYASDNDIVTVLVEEQQVIGSYHLEFASKINSVFKHHDLERYDRLVDEILDLLGTIHVNDVNSPEMSEMCNLSVSDIDFLIARHTRPMRGFTIDK